MADIKDPKHESRCPYCDEWVGMLHGGAMYLYVKNGRIEVLDDMDHVYNDCPEGLKEDIRALYRMFMDLRSRGLEIFGVGKAYDDDLYALVFRDLRDTEY